MNPRRSLRPETVFETAAFWDRSRDPLCESRGSSDRWLTGSQFFGSVVPVLVGIGLDQYALKIELESHLRLPLGSLLASRPRIGS